MSKTETEYQGPETNDFYEEDTGEYETFDDLDDDGDHADDEIQGTTSHDESDLDDDGNEIAQKPTKKEAKEQKKKDRGQKSDDMEALDLSEDEEDEIRDIDEEEESEEDEEEKEDEKEEEEKEEKKEEEKSAEEKKEEAKKKGKPTYVKIGEETFALDSNALISTQVDGKTEQVSIQELKNHYAGKVAWDKKFNEINVKEQSIKKTQSEFESKINHIKGVESKILEVMKDAERNPLEAFEIFVDSIGLDAYDLKERMFKAELTELSNVLAMDPTERKAYFLERKNNHLLNQAEKRKQKALEDDKRNSYIQKANALRTSSGVSEVQYVEAYEELTEYGYKDEDLTEKDIVEWAATKPHRTEVSALLEPYQDQISQDAYGELSWKLVGILRSGQETPEVIKKHLAEVFGLPSEVKELSKKLNPVGRKKAPVSKAKTSPKKYSYESFDDIDDE